ncbi:MAG: diacylglycerol/lipid kinase family protein [Chitinophagales bacterium]
MKEWFLLVNPFAGGGKTEKKKQKVFELLQRNNISFEAAESYSRKEAIKIIHEKIAEGFRKFIALGGDGTLNSLANGIFSQQNISPSEITIALIPVGTGNDWIKMHHIPKSVSKAIEVIRQGKTFLHDVGIFRKKNSEEEIRYFINVAGCGFQGFVAERIEGATNWLKIGPAAFYFGLIEALSKYKTTQIKIETNEKSFEGKFFNVSIGICKSAGGGMQLTPNAVADDGLFDITVAGDLSKGEVIQNIPRLFNGKFVHHHKISQFRTKKISVSSVPSAPLETDGEVFGYGDFEAEILEKAIRVISNNR